MQTSDRSEDRVVRVRRGAPIKGRGSSANPESRFERLDVVYDDDWRDGGEAPRKTVFLLDTSRTVLSYNDSPDLPFSVSLNPYRGCEHGCSYCYARPTHEYLGFSAGLDFESKIVIKQQAPRLLRQALSASTWEPQLISLSGVTDAYQPVERKLEISRRCLEVLAEFRNPVGIVTKNSLVTRDLDLLRELAAFDAVSVLLSITTLDGELARRLEPRASHPRRRLQAIEELANAGIPVGASVAPIIPGLTDHEIPAILEAVAAAGGGFAISMLLRLPHGVKDLFETWLLEHYPQRRRRVLERVRDVRAGSLNDSRFGHRMRGEGVYADQIAQLFRQARNKVSLAAGGPRLSTAAFRRPGGTQLRMF